MSSKDGHGLKAEKLGELEVSAKSPKNYCFVVVCFFSDGICLIDTSFKTLQLPPG